MNDPSHSSHSPDPSAAEHGAAASSVFLQDRARRPRKERLRRWMLALAAAGAVGAALWSFARGRPEQNTRWITARRRALPRILREMGIVVARHEVSIFSPFTGEIIWKIEEGALVGPGAVIVRFDATKVREELEQMQQDLFDKQEAVRRAEKEWQRVRRRYKIEIAKLENALERAQLERDRVYGQPLADDQTEARLTLQAANLKLAQAQRDYRNYEELNRHGFVTEAVLKQKRLQRARERAEFAKAKALYDLTMQGATADAKRQADLKVTEARQNLSTGRFNRDADLASAKAQLELARISLDDFNLSLSQKQRQLQNAEVKVPKGARGRVAFVDVWKGPGSLSPIQVGETRNRGHDLCKVVDLSRLRVKVFVNEADVSKLRAGQAVRVALPAIPERTFRARVAEIALVALDKNVALSRLALQQSGEAFVNVVETYLDFEGLSGADRAAIRLGFTAEARIECGAPREALALPWTALLFDEDGAPCVELRTPLGGVETRKVRLGRSDEFLVEVREGLDGTERVRDRSGGRGPPGEGAAQGGAASRGAAP